VIAPVNGASMPRAGDAALPSADGANAEAADPARPRWIAGKAQTQRLGYGQYPLAVRRAGQDAVDQMYRGNSAMIATSAMVMAAGKYNRPAILPGAGGRGAPVLGYNGRTATVSV
jgi:hypothetical protein